MEPAADVRGITAVILGGGRGSRLLPLTLYRAKPAVGFGGKYRIIDIPLSNCINSGIKRIFVLTQFLSTSLHRHIMQSYRFDQFTEGFVEILAAQQTHLGQDWFQGPADAVRATLDHTMYYKSDQILILPGDQLYRMDYADLVRFHRERQADITICLHPVDCTEARRMGLAEVAPSGLISRYAEKPQDANTIESFRVPQYLNLAPEGDLREKVLASTGIYVFEPKVLSEALSESTAADFGAGIFQSAIRRFKVAAYVFLDYWQDIGTIEAFFTASIALGSRQSPFRLYAPHWPLCTRARSLPPSHITSSEIRDTLVAEGVFISGASIEESVVGVRNVVRQGSVLKQVVMLGTDFYEGEQFLSGEAAEGDEVPPLGVGKGSVIERAIIDKNVRIGDNVTIRAKPEVRDFKGDGYWIRDGITVIPKGTVIPSGTEL
jgi:glucose-1-phosphate adenylyltransferase